MNTDTTVRNFQKFIISSWPMVETIFKEKTESLEFKEAVDDWFQANWEILVEQTLCSPDQFLEVYGDGADCNGNSSRVWLPEAKETHRIICKSKNNQKTKDCISGKLIIPDDYQFDGFISWENNAYMVTPPFDHVLLSSLSDSFVVNLNEIHFILEEI